MTEGGGEGVVAVRSGGYHLVSVPVSPDFILSSGKMTWERDALDVSSIKFTDLNLKHIPTAHSPSTEVTFGYIAAVTSRLEPTKNWASTLRSSS